jgi:hypothetical protein
VEGYAGSGFGQRNGNARAQSTRRSGDECDLTLQVELIKYQGMILSGWGKAASVTAGEWLQALNSAPGDAAVACDDADVQCRQHQGYSREWGGATSIRDDGRAFEGRGGGSKDQLFCGLDENGLRLIEIDGKQVAA